MNKQTFGFIGLGLIGGSIAKALKTAYPDCTIIAYDINMDSLLLAQDESVVDVVTFCINEAFAPCDYLFLCAPVAHNDKNLITLKQYLSPDCLLTDVGSVKATIHSHIAELGLESQFIGGHPMAGSERIGYSNSKALLLENAYYIMTPTKQVLQSKIDAYREIILSMGAIPLVLTCKQHDYVTAAVSHLPHIIASSLVNLIKEADSEDEIMKLIAAGGFKDITRIASSSPTMWQHICLANPKNISLLLDSYIQSLQKIKKDIDDSQADNLLTLFEDARTYRDSFSNASSGPIKKSYAIYLDIADEPGALASIATLLAQHEISIQNIGITHNREFQDGVLRVEFPQEQTFLEAGKLLMRQGYTLH